MINIDELRQQVEAAEQRFGQIDNSQRKASARLIGMMNAIEQDQTQKQSQLEDSKALISNMARENQQLCAMLNTLLMAIEAAGGDQSTEFLRQMDDKLTAMVSTGDSASDDDTATVEGADIQAVETAMTNGEADEAIVDEVLPAPPGVLPTAPEQIAEAAGVAEADDTGTSDDDDASEAASGVREILERMTQKKLQKAAGSAASSQT